MGQPSTSNQIRAVALREAVASAGPRQFIITDDRAALEEQKIIKRAEAFASYIEHGPEVDPNA